jgi:hypothetical protein
VKAHDFNRLRGKGLELDPEPEEERLFFRPGPGKRATADGIPARPLQRKASGHSATGTIDAKSSPGEPLPEDVRRRMERAFGADFSDVRIHVGAEAAAVGARAFTQGADIHFAPGEYDPSSLTGLELLGHELAHVIQQAQGRVVETGERGGLPAADDSWLEHEADEMGARAAHGAIVEVAYGMTPMPQRTPVQRKPEDDPKAEARKGLADIQGHAMFALLPRLKDMNGSHPDWVGDFDLGQQVGGPRLVIAMKAVKHGGDWLSYVGANQDVGQLWTDQVIDIMNFLGAPADAKYYPADAFGGKFDAAVSPSESKLTLVWRVKFESAGKRFTNDPNPEAQEKAAKEAMAKFARDFPPAVEGVWKGRIKPVKPIGSLSGFNCGVKVFVVDSGQHKLIHVHSTLNETGGERSNMDSDPAGDGNLRDTANQPTPRTKGFSKDGKHPDPNPQTYNQPASAHEAGHAWGLDHPNCNHEEERKAGRDPGRDFCYAANKEQASSVMGLGKELKVTDRAGIHHDDYAPFISIAQKWGSEVPFPGLDAKHNVWTPD